MSPFHQRLAARGLALAAALLLSAPASALTCDWTGAVTVEWADPANWTNCSGGVPGLADTAVVTSLPFNQPVVLAPASISGLSLGAGSTLTVDFSGNLTLDGNASGAGNINVIGILTWISGAMSGTGTTTIAPSGTLSLFNMASKVLSRNLVNNGTTTMTGGNSSLIITTGVTFTNLALYEIHNGSDITGNGAFVNNGQFRIPSGGTVSVTVATWINSGTVEALSGTLSIGSTVGTHGGGYSFVGTRLSFPAGTHTVTATLSGTVLEMNTSVAFLAAANLFNFFGTMEIRGPVSFDTGEIIHPLTLVLQGAATISGADSLTTLNCTWDAGTLTGTGTFTILGGGTLVMNGPGARTLDRDLFNHGAATMGLAAGTLVIPPNRTFHNEANGSFSIANDPILTGQGTFENLGQFFRNTSAGTATVDLDFRNAGTVSLESGTTVFHEYLQTAGTTDLAGGNISVRDIPTVFLALDVEGGILKGSGTIDAIVFVGDAATIAPGTSPGELTILGWYAQSQPGAYEVELAGTASGQYDKISVADEAVLGGTLNVSLSFAAPPGASFPILTYPFRLGEFSLFNLPPPPAGLSWLTRYGATEFSLRLQTMLPTDPLRVDTHAASGGGSNLNNVFEPGERVSVEPTWVNPTAGPIGATGTASSLTGPPGAVYTIEDAAADYGSIPGNGGTANCFDTTGNCYTLLIDDPPTRPAVHWDATLDETLNNGDVASWTLHIGRSFDDLLVLDPFYRFVETLFHNGVTGGCGPTSFCPGVPVTRAEMAVFLLSARFGVSYKPRQATGTVFTDVPADGFAATYIEELFARSITAGCDVTLYCPNGSATREQMAVFLLRTLEGPTYVPPDCTTPTFLDVPCSSGFAKWIEEIFRRGITSGCGPSIYCPTSPVLRAQMAVFLTITFGFGLNGA